MEGIDVSNGRACRRRKRPRRLPCHSAGRVLLSRFIVRGAHVPVQSPRTRESALIRSHRGYAPQIAASAYIDPQATVIGDVVIGEDSSVWPGAVVRGDCHSIRIGACTNIQDGSVLHVQQDEFALSIGDNVTVGHGAILHGCTVESECLIGMGSILLNGSKVGSGSIIAAGTLIPPGAEIPPGSMVMGSPGKVRRPVTEAERKIISQSAEHYVGFKNLFKAEEYG
jgi:carbonic anhydrase/acetyltransferase-like protein (isoleucine patch superfamily)